jgi:uncharacterized protein
VIADFCAETSIPFYEKIMKQLEGLKVRLAFLNAGMGGKGDFIDQPQERVQNMIDCNVYHVTMLLKMFVDKFEKTKERSGICITSSNMAMFPSPSSTHYAMTKAYEYFLGKAVANE